MICLRSVFVLVLSSAVLQAGASAQFVDEFEGGDLAGWMYLTGDGEATMDFRPADGYASVFVDATKDEYNVWWALIKREVSDDLDLDLLSRPGFELRVEARVRPNHAPRRVNLHVNTQRTTDFHTHLMEYDLSDTTRWHTISMTTHGFEAGPGDTVRAQLALMDWGLGRYRVDLDYLKVDVVEAGRAPLDEGEPIAYHPSIPPTSAFDHHVAVLHGGMVSLRHPDMNLDGWHAADRSGDVAVLTAGHSTFVILRWDLSDFAGREADSAGLLELTTHSLMMDSTAAGGLAQIRVVEIPGGDPAWEEDAVTLETWTRGLPLARVANTQMIIDVEVARYQGGSTFATINRPVMQRLLDGRTLGLMLRPLGAISATFYRKGHGVPRLHFDLKPGP